MFYDKVGNALHMPMVTDKLHMDEVKTDYPANAPSLHHLACNDPIVSRAVIVIEAGSDGQKEGERPEIM